MRTTGSTAPSNKPIRPTKDLSMAIVRLKRVTDGYVSLMCYRGEYHGSIAGDVAAVLRALESGKSVVAVDPVDGITTG